MSKSKPKPCPFCGGECLTSNAVGGMWRVYCEKDMTCFYSSGTFVTEAEAIAAHNRVCRAVETAAKQAVTDCNHLGNAAKMREALSRILGITDHLQTRPSPFRLQSGAKKVR